QRRKGCVVALVKREIGLRIAELVAPHDITPANVPADGFGIRVEHDLVRIEAVPLARFIGAVYTKPIELPRSQIRQETVPDHIGLLLNRDAQSLLLVVDTIEQAQLDLRCIL